MDSEVSWKSTSHTPLHPQESSLAASPHLLIVTPLGYHFSAYKKMKSEINLYFLFKINNIVVRLSPQNGSGVACQR